MLQLRLGFIGLVGLLVGTASAQAPQGGLVDVDIADVTFQVPLAVAAHICDVDGNDLFADLQDGTAQCGTGTITLTGDMEGGESPRHSDLINVQITGVDDAQVPLGMAATVCGVAVNQLATLLQQGPVNCTQFGRSATVSD